jgi:hypothetical protein
MLLLLPLWSSVSAQVQVSHRFLNNNVLEMFFLKDFDINSPATGPPIFFVDIKNDAQLREVILGLSIESQRHGPLSRGETLPFTLNPFQILTLSNNNFFSSTDPYRLDSYEVSENVVRELLKDILSTGKLPTDVYLFNVIVRDNVNQSPLDQDSFEIRVSNPRKIDLIFPGRPASGRREDCPKIFTNLPQFRWESDMRRFRVIIAEARPGEDPESALNQEPRFVRIFALSDDRALGVRRDGSRFAERVEIIPSTSFQYPSSGEILTLRPGRTYYWRVTGLVQTSSGPVELQSEIYCFRIAKLDELDGRNTQLEFILRSLLGSDYNNLFGEGGELEGYRAKRIVLDGEEITLVELLKRLQKIKSNYSGYRVE